VPQSSRRNDRRETLAAKLRRVIVTPTGIEAPATAGESPNDSSALQNASRDDWREVPPVDDASRTLAAVRSLERAIEALTHALASATDEDVAELVRERRAMRDELQALREASAGNVVPFRRGTA
jgi:hypothetical protein